MSDVLQEMFYNGLSALVGSGGDPPPDSAVNCVTRIGLRCIDAYLEAPESALAKDIDSLLDILRDREKPDELVSAIGVQAREQLLNIITILKKEHERRNAKTA